MKTIKVPTIQRATKEVQVSIMYRGLLFSLQEIPCYGETTTHFYDVSRSEVPKWTLKKSNRDSFFSSDRRSVVRWLDTRRQDRVQKLNLILAQAKHLPLDYELVHRLKLGRDESGSFETYTIESVGRTIKTKETRDQMYMKAGGVAYRKQARYLQIDRFPPAAPTDQLAFGTWLIIRGDKEQHEKIMDWLQKRIEWLRKLDW